MEDPSSSNPEQERAINAAVGITETLEWLVDNEYIIRTEGGNEDEPASYLMFNESDRGYTQPIDDVNQLIVASEDLFEEGNYAEAYEGLFLAATRLAELMINAGIEISDDEEEQQEVINAILAGDPEQVIEEDEPTEGGRRKFRFKRKRKVAAHGRGMQRVARRQDWIGKDEFAVEQDKHDYEVMKALANKRAKAITFDSEPLGRPAYSSWATTAEYQQAPATDKKAYVLAERALQQRWALARMWRPSWGNGLIQ